MRTEEIFHETEWPEDFTELAEKRNEDFYREIDFIMCGKSALSFSSLKAFRQSPKHFYHYKSDKETTKAMNEGKMFHLAILEPEKFESEYWVLDDSAKVLEIGGGNPRLTKVYKEWVIEQVEKNKGKEMISKSNHDLYLGMGEYLMKCSATRDLMAGLTEKETSIEFYCSDLLINGRIDGAGKDYLIDLKKVADASFKKVKWIINDMFYDMQGAIYCHATRKAKYYLIFIDPSCNVTVVKLSEETLKNGFGSFTVALEEFKRCAEEDLFQSSYEFYNNGFIEV